jgi:hypothetical protein
MEIFPSETRISMVFSELFGFYGFEERFRNDLGKMMEIL